MWRWRRATGTPSRSTAVRRVPYPRATRLPDGVHGLAQVVDHGAFSWTDAAWRPRPLRDAVIYELHVGTYSPEGTFDGALARLDHLVRLGVSHVELMPVHAFPGTHGWGYDPAGLYAVHEPYGGPDGLKRLVDACHARGLAVLLDVIYNHLGPEGNYLGEFGPYVTDRFRTPWGGAINLGEAGADDVRRFIVDNALAWLRDYHIDGLRIDAVHAFADFTAVHLLEQMAVEVAELERTLGRPLTLIAESDLNDPRLLWPRERGGYGLHAQWSDDFHHALHSTLTGERDGYYEDFQGLPDLASALERTWVYDGRYSRHRGRAHGRPPTGLAMDRFLGYAQNHDQVGNRAAGERLSQLVGSVGAQGRRGARPVRALHPDAVPGRGVGCIHPIPVLRGLRGRVAARGDPGGPTTGVRRVRVAGGSRPGPVGSRDTAALAAGLGRGLAPAACRPAGMAPDAHRASGGTSRSPGRCASGDPLPARRGLVGDGAGRRDGGGEHQPG